MGVKIIAKRASAPSVRSFCKAPASCPTAPAKTRSKKSSSQLVRRSSRSWPSAVRSGGELMWMGVDNGRLRRAGRGSGRDPRRIAARTDQSGHEVPFPSCWSLKRSPRRSRRPGQLGFPLVLRGRRGWRGRGWPRPLGKPPTRVSRGLIGRPEYHPEGDPMVAMNITAISGISSQIQLGMSFSVPGMPSALCRSGHLRGRLFCLTDSTLGPERRRQIRHVYGDPNHRRLDLDRGIRRTTEPGPTPGVRFRGKPAA